MSRRALAEQLTDWITSFTKKPAKGGIDELMMNDNQVRFWDSIHNKPTLTETKDALGNPYYNDMGEGISLGKFLPEEPNYPKAYTDAWETIDGVPTGSPKPNASRRVNPDTGLTYDGSEFPMSLDPSARNITPNGQSAPIAPVTEQDIVLDAGNNFVNQPAEGLNSVAIKNMPEDTAGLLTQGDSPLASMIEDTASIGTATRERLSKLPQRIKDEMMQAPDKEGMMVILRKYHTDNNNSVLTKNDINGLGRENLNLVDNNAIEVSRANKSDTHFTQPVTGADEVPLADVVIKDIETGLTSAESIADAKVIKNLYYNKQKAPDDVLNSLTRKLTDLQAKPTSIDNNKLIESIQFAMKDIVDNSYRGVHKTSQSILEKTPTQALNRIGREITKGADGKIMNIEKYDAEEQLFRELAESSKAKNLDEIEDGMTFDGSGNGVGKEHTDSITDILDELKNRKLDPKKKSTPKVNKRVKRGNITGTSKKSASEIEEELMPWLQDFPNYGRGRL